MSEEEIKPKDLVTTIIELNDLLLDKASESASLAFNVGCIIGIFGIAIIVVLAWVFSNWVAAVIALIISGLLGTSVSALMSMSARTGNIKQTFKREIEPRLDEICTQFGIEREEFIVKVYATLAEESPLAQFFAKPAMRMSEPAKATDLADIVILLKSCELPYEDLTTSHLERFLVVREADQIIGCVGLEIVDKYALLRSLAVNEALRGTGLGTLLTDQAESLASMFGIQTIYLLTTTAERFFARHGYQITQRGSAPQPLQETSEFKTICPDSAVCMKKELA